MNDEANHLIASSRAPSSIGGTSRPSALVVEVRRPFVFYLFCTGRSVGDPRRMRST